MGIYVRELASEQIKRIEERMRPEALSESGFLSPQESLIDVIESDERTLDRLGITPKQIGDRLESLIQQAFRIRELDSRGRVRKSWLSHFTSLVLQIYRVFIMLTLTTIFKVDLIYRTASLRYILTRLVIPPKRDVLVEGKFLVSSVSYCGWQDCPFENSQGEPCQEIIYSTTDFSIKNTINQQSIDFPGLAIHLIRDHHFFEGSVKYRVDPEKAIGVLGIKPGVDYAPKYLTEHLWEKDWTASDRWERAERDNLRESEHFDEIVTAASEIITLGEQVWIYISGDKCTSVARSDYRLRKPVTIQGADLQPEVIMESELRMKRTLGIPKGITVWNRVKWSYVAAEGYE